MPDSTETIKSVDGIMLCLLESKNALAKLKNIAILIGSLVRNALHEGITL